MAENIAAQQQAHGQPVKLPPMSRILKQADALAFSVENVAAEKKKQQDAIREQSNRRRPAAGRPARSALAAAGKAGGDKESPIDMVVHHPDVVDFWNKLQEANGTK